MKVKIDLKVLFAFFIKAIYPALKHLFLTIGMDGYKRAVALVKEAESHRDWDGDTKYKFVYDGLVEWFKAKGREVKENRINLLIELAVEILTSAFGG